jgi:hypothetical protein
MFTEDWYSGTPELVAAHVANRVQLAMANTQKPLKRDYVVLDALTRGFRPIFGQIIL